MNGIRVFMLFLLVSLCPAATLPLVRGRVQTDTAYLGSELMAELKDLERQTPADRVVVAGDGSFEFRDVTAGRHTLRITSMFGDTICEETVDVMTFTGDLSIRLPKRALERPGSGTISVRELQRPVPRKAFQAFVEAQREAESGRGAEAVRKLKLALRLYPDYSAARINLGVQYVRLGRARDALEQFEKAVADGESSAILYANLSYAYFWSGRLPDAEYAARRAVALDSRYFRAHYLLGSILAQKVRPGALEKAPEAARHLRLGAVEIPRAHIDIAQIYLAEEDPLSAVEELRLYLQTGDTTHREKVQHWLEALRAETKKTP